MTLFAMSNPAWHCGGLFGMQSTDGRHSYKNMYWLWEKWCLYFLCCCGQVMRKKINDPWPDCLFWPSGPVIFLSRIHSIFWLNQLFWQNAHGSSFWFGLWSLKALLFHPLPSSQTGVPNILWNIGYAKTRRKDSRQQMFDITEHWARNSAQAKYK